MVMLEEKKRKINSQEDLKMGRILRSESEDEGHSTRKDAVLKSRVALTEGGCRE